MKNNKYYAFIAICSAGMLLGSCSKDFLNTEPSGLYSAEQLSEIEKWNPSILGSRVQGINATVFESGSMGIGGHSDFGQKSIDIQTDLLSSDMEMTHAPKYGHFGSAEDMTGTATTSTAYTYGNWRYLYKLVFAANAVFDSFGSDEIVPDKTKEPDRAKYFAQSKVLRGFAYYNLGNLFSLPYSEAKDKPCVPIYRSLKNSKPGSPSSLKEVMDLAISDIKTGYEILDGMPHDANKDNINDDVALGLLAYAYLQTDNWQEALNCAKKLIDKNKYPLMTAEEVLNSGFRSYTIPEFIWCIDVTKENTGHLVTFWGHMDIFTMSYPSVGDVKIINPDLYESIPKTDVRKNWFLDDKADEFYLAPYYKFYAEGREVQGDRSWLNDIVFLRASEMYLIASECAARLDKLNDSKMYLKTLLKNRYNYLPVEKDATMTASKKAEKIKEETEKFVAVVDGYDKQQLLDAVLYNWRVEMWGEGRALMTKKRFKTDIKRSSLAHSFPGQTIKYNDKRLVYDYPERETANNINIK